MYVLQGDHLLLWLFKALYMALAILLCRHLAFSFPCQGENSYSSHGIYSLDPENGLVLSVLAPLFW